MTVRHVEQVMGTVFSIVADSGEGIPAAVARLHAIDAKFSTLPRRQRDQPHGPRRAGRVRPGGRRGAGRCAEVEAETDGAFTAYPAGRLDPSGWVKGWAIEEVDRLLAAAGSRNHLIVGGGDIQARGEAELGRPWTVGIADPLQPDRFRALVSGRDFAVATSGTAERGAHIIDPATARPPPASRR